MIDPEALRAALRGMLKIPSLREALSRRLLGASDFVDAGKARDFRRAFPVPPKGASGLADALQGEAPTEWRSRFPNENDPNAPPLKAGELAQARWGEPMGGPDEASALVRKSWRLALLKLLREQAPNAFMGMLGGGALAAGQDDQDEQMRA